MLHTFEAVIDPQGAVLLKEAIRLPATRRALVTILDEPVKKVSESKLRPFGLCAGEFTVPDDFDDPWPVNLSRWTGPLFGLAQM
ncbi:MAG: hypothetical protein ACPGWR_21245 [Ardenticatenaceae bacterium]